MVHPAVEVLVFKSTCPMCGIRYGYNSVGFGAQGEDVWYITPPREYLLITNQLLVTRRLLNSVQQRIVLQQVWSHHPVN